MSTIAFIRAAAGFAAGAVVGGGLTAITTNRMHSPPESLPPAPVTVDQTISHPLSVEQQRSLNAASLKYGFPRMMTPSLRYVINAHSYPDYSGSQLECAYPTRLCSGV